MSNKLVYVAGNVSGLPADGVVEFFNGVAAQLRVRGFKVLVPTRGKYPACMPGDGCGTMASFTFPAYGVNEIVHRDLNDVDRSCIVLAFMSEPSIGTSMEILYAREITRIPVIVVSSNPKVADHYWIRAYASKICATQEEAFDELTAWWGY